MMSRSVDSLAWENTPVLYPYVLHGWLELRFPCLGSAFSHLIASSAWLSVLAKHRVRVWHIRFYFYHTGRKKGNTTLWWWLKPLGINSWLAVDFIFVFVCPPWLACRFSIGLYLASLHSACVFAVHSHTNGACQRVAAPLLDHRTWQFSSVCPPNPCEKIIDTLL